jgi:hypothetical protein
VVKSSGSNIEKENILLEFSTTEDGASLFEDQDFDREYLFSPRQNKNCLGSFQVLWNKNCTTKNEKKNYENIE